MDLEKLTKHQIVLLTLLVSFVTSIATGIVTVSLMDQASPGVTKVINQIVEHTVEKVVPAVTASATQNPAAVATVTTEKTVVVKDDDLAAQSIASVQKALVRIVVRGSDQLVARGVIVDKQGTALTDRAAIEATGETSFEAYLYSSEKVPVKILSSHNAPGSSFLVLDLVVGTSSGFAPAPLADLSKVKLGSSVIRIGGTGADTVGSGVVASLPDAKTVEATVSSATPGSVLMTMFGEIIGLSTGASESLGNDFYSIPSLATSTPHS